MPISHFEAASLHLDQADSLDLVIRDCRNDGQHERAGRVLQHQRAEVKRAEVHALMAIADELSRIGLTR